MNGRNTVRYTKASTPHKRYPTCGLKIICNAIAFVCMCGARELNEAASGCECEWIWVHRKSSIHFYLLSVPFKAHISACLSWPGEYPLHNTLITHSLARSLARFVCAARCAVLKLSLYIHFVLCCQLSVVACRSPFALCLSFSHGKIMDYAQNWYTSYMCVYRELCSRSSRNTPNRWWCCAFGAVEFRASKPKFLITFVD